MKAYKVFTHDLCSPIQGGEPVWDGRLPFQLPEVEVDEGPDACKAGWNACRKLSDALRIAGLWPNGWPSKAFIAEDPGHPLVERGKKVRASTWTLTRELTEYEIAIGVRNLSAAFGDHAERMAASQMAWREALCRPFHDVVKVESGLFEALKIRGLNWKLKRFDDARAAWAAWDARDAWAARDARAARAAWAAWDAWAARDARDAWAAWDARDARDAWDARAARDARDALTFEYASLKGWVDYAPDLLTIGIRDAYKHGLAMVLPTDPQELGWAMVKEKS